MTSKMNTYLFTVSFGADSNEKATANLREILNGLIADHGPWCAFRKGGAFQGVYADQDEDGRLAVTRVIKNPGADGVCPMCENKCSSTP